MEEIRGEKTAKVRHLEESKRRLRRREDEVKRMMVRGWSRRR